MILSSGAYHSLMTKMQSLLTNPFVLTFFMIMAMYLAIRPASA